MPTVTTAGEADPWIPADGVPDLDAVLIEVFRRERTSGPGEPETYAVELEPMPSLEPISVEWHDGARPKTARIAYKFGDDRAQSPQWFEEALSLAVDKPEIVKPGDRLLIRAWLPGTAGYRFVFDGFAYTFSVSVDEDNEEVIIDCIGVEKRLGDKPIGGMILRNADTPEDTNVPSDDEDPGSTPKPNHVRTSLPAIFNPDGKPNCTPDDADYFPEGEAFRDHPVFLDPAVIRDPDVRTKWTLPKAVAYLAYTENPDEGLVVNPSRGDMNDTLVQIEPKEGKTFDRDDPETYDAVAIEVPELPVTGKALAATVEGLIGDKGFACKFRLGLVEGETIPETRWLIYREQETEIKSILLQRQGTTLDLRSTNLGSFSFSRDVAEAVNHWVVEGALDRHEVGVVLQCGYPSEAADAADATALAQWNLHAEAFATHRDKYRLYVFDETGEGHYAVGTDVKRQDVPSLDGVFGAPVDGVPRYARRRRPAIGELIQTDANGRPYRHRLWYSTDYDGSRPSVWHGTAGTWKPIQGGYELLADRLGIYVTIADPNAWNVGPGPDGGGDVILKGVESQATPTTENPKFYLRLECVIEADECLKGEATRREAEGASGSEARRDAAILPETVTRFVDARNRFRRDIIDISSEFSAGVDKVVFRDDTDAAEAEALALRDATDAGVLEGPAVIPWFTMFYDIGDRIDMIRGRDLGLRTDGGAEADTPVLPSVRSISWQLRGDQTTTLTLSDNQKLRKNRRRQILSSVAMYSRGSRRKGRR